MAVREHSYCSEFFHQYLYKFSFVFLKFSSKNIQVIMGSVDHMSFIYLECTSMLQVLEVSIVSY